MHAIHPIGRLAKVFGCVWALLMLAGPPLAAEADQPKSACSVTAASHPVALVELYTSEGCSSCPPADRWLSSLRANGLAPTRVVPLAFHVDYWNDLGWPDRFSDRRFTAKQREAVSRGGARMVYTPQVMLNGKDFPWWRRPGAFEGAVRAWNEPPVKATLRLSAKATSGGWRIHVGGGALKPRATQVFLGLYENGLSSDVRAGENRGTRLQHDYVVREWVGPLYSADPVRLDLDHLFASRPDIRYAQAGVVAVLQDRVSGEPLQVAALGLCGSGM